LLAGPDAGATRDALAALERTLPDDVGIVVIADDVEVPSTEHEVVRTSARLGAGAALNIGIRRARGEVVVVRDSTIVATADLVTPLIQALADPNVAVVGSRGYQSVDMQRFDAVEPSGEALDVAAIGGPLMAFRRADAVARGPIDEGFRIDTYLDVWWSLVLRDGAEGVAPRRAVAIPLPAERHEHRGWTSLPDDERNRLSKRNFYRIIDRFGSRRDLATG